MLHASLRIQETWRPVSVHRALTLLSNKSKTIGLHELRVQTKQRQKVVKLRRLSTMYASARGSRGGEIRIEIL